jgi:hypothetical protein
MMSLFLSLAKTVTLMIATPSMVVEDVLHPGMVSASSIAAAELVVERRSRRAVEVLVIGVRTKTKPRKWRAVSTKMKL